jgi:hypothetical protein
MAIQVAALFSCPHYGFAQEEIMPTDACQIVYVCTSCGSVLRPKVGDCCVFCSYADRPCPLIQHAQGDVPIEPAQE